MSLYEVEEPALTLGPRVRGSDEHIVARSSLVLEALSLFSWSREVEVDAKARHVRIATRTLWRRNPPREIPFSDIRCIWRTAKRLSAGVLIPDEGAHRLERFLVTLELTSGEKIPLFTFSGQDSQRTGLRGVILGGDPIVSVHGAQDRESVSFARHVATLTGAQLMDAPF